MGILERLTGRFVQLDTAARVIRVSQLGVAALVSRIPSGEALKGAVATIQDEHLAVELRLADGVTAAAKVRPTHLTWDGTTLGFEAQLPGGVKAGHADPIKHFFVGFVDRLAGVANSKLRSVEGVTLEGEQPRYAFRPPEVPALLSALGASASQPGRPLRIPLDVRDGFLELSFGDIPNLRSSLVITQLIKLVAGTTSR